MLFQLSFEVILLKPIFDWVYRLLKLILKLFVRTFQSFFLETNDRYVHGKTNDKYVHGSYEWKVEIHSQYLKYLIQNTLLYK